MKGDTRSERAARRRFALLVMLHNRPHTYHEIISRLDQQKLFDYDRSAEPATIARQQQYQFRHDLAALRQMGCQIEFERNSKSYTWHNSPFGLHLSTAQLSTFALQIGRAS